MTPLQKRINTAAAALIERTTGLARHAGATDAGANATALDALEWTAALRAELDELEALIVRQARLENASWSEIADPIGITRQGAQQRWG
jgi:hypothetical protein